MYKHYVFYCLFLLASMAWGQADWSPANNQWFRANATSITAGASSGSTDTLYMAESDSLHKSTNSGASWITTSDVILAPLAVACNPTLANIVCVGKAGKLYYSSNGNSFTQKLSKSNDPTFIVYSKANTSYAYAGFTADADGDTCLYRTTNGGVDWVGVPAFAELSNSFFTDVRQVAVLENNADYVYVCGETGGYNPNDGEVRQGLFFSTNATGAADYTASNLTSGTDDLMAVGVYDSANSGTRQVYVGYKNGTFKHHRHSSGSVLTSGTWNTISLSGSPSAIYNIQTSHDTVYVVTDNGIYAKYGGAWNNTFTKINSGMIYVAMKSLAIGSNNSSQLYVTGDSTAYKSTNFGSSWNLAVENLMAVSVTSTSPLGSKRASVSSEFVTLGFTSGSSSIDKQLLESGVAKKFYGNHILDNPFSTSYWYASGGVNTSGSLIKAYFFRSTDDGSTWEKTKSSTTGGSLQGSIIDPVATAQLYAFGEITTSSNYSINTNYGASASWTDKSLSPAGNVIYTMALDPTGGGAHSQAIIGYIGQQSTTGSNGGLFRSADLYNASPTWTRWSTLGTGVNNPYRTIFAITLNTSYPSIVYAGGQPKTDIYGMWISTNSGSTWDTIGTRTDTVKRILLDPRWQSESTSSHLFVVARANGGSDKIYYSSNQGVSWSDATGSLPTPIYDLRSDPTDSSIIYVATAKGVFTASRTPTTLSSPSNGVSVGYKCLTLSWGSVTGATSYRIQIATNSDFSSPSKDTVTSLTSYAFNASCNQTYYWRVDVNNTFGESPWSETRSFTTNLTPSAPTLSSPADGTTDLLLCHADIQWQSICIADSYHVQVSTSAVFSTTVFNQIIAPTSYSLSAVLSTGTTYYWRVAGKNCSGEGSYSSTRSFTTSVVSSTPAAPTLINPSNNATGVPRNTPFGWSTVTGTEYYTIQVSTQSNFSSYFINETTPYSGRSQWNSGNYMSSNTKYYWRVSATNCYGTSAATPDSFTTGTGILDPSFITPGYDQIKEVKPKETQLLQNYPNPFNPVTEIQYTLSEDQYVTLKVYDMLGREVVTLVNQYESAGYKTATFDARSLPSGIYIYRIQAGKFTDIKKMLLMK